MSVGPNPIMNPPEKKESRTGPVVYMQYMGRPVWTPRDYAHFAKEGYVQNAIVYRCIRLISDACMSIPFMVFKDDQPVDTHPFLDLMRAPNPFEGTADLVDALYSYLMIAGNTYLEQITLGGKVAELHVLRPDRMKVVLDNKGRPAEYIYEISSQSPVRFKASVQGQREILHIKQFHPLHDVYGLSPIEPAAFSIDVHTEAGGFNKALLQNSARPSGALVVTPDKEGDASITEEQYARLKGEIEQYTGAKNAGRPMLLEGGLDWRPMGLTPQDLEFTQGKNQAAREIALSFGVPPMILGIPGDNTYSNYKEANVAFYRQTVLPIVTKVCQSLSVFFMPSYGEDFKVWFDIDEIAGLTQEREDTWTRINTSSVLTVNEKREALGYDEVEGGDDVLIQSSLIPLNQEIEDETLDPSTDPNADPNANPEDTNPDEDNQGDESGQLPGGGDPGDQPSEG